jgi:hypothetical protein
LYTILYVSSIGRVFELLAVIVLNLFLHLV